MITDRPDMTVAVYRGCKAIKQTNQTFRIIRRKLSFKFQFSMKFLQAKCTCKSIAPNEMLQRINGSRSSPLAMHLAYRRQLKAICTNNLWQKQISLNILLSNFQKMSRIMRKPAFCICETKDADQLHSNHPADQRLCFRYIDSTISHNS